MASFTFSRRVLGRLAAASLLGAPLARAAQAQTEPPLDFAVEHGRHFRQASPQNGQGFQVENGAHRMWDAYRRAGGPGVLGYPVSALHANNGVWMQLFTHGGMQAAAAAAPPQPVNVLELLDAAGLADWLHAQRQVPLPLDDGSASYAEAVERRLGWLHDDAIRTAYFANPDPARFLTWTQDDALRRFGLPMSLPGQSGARIVQRFQRGVMERTVDQGAAQTWAVGDLLIERGLLPDGARTPTPSAPAYAEAAGRTIHDRLEAAVRARIAAEPGVWAVYAAASGAERPLVAIEADRDMPAMSLWKLTLLREAYRRNGVGRLSFDERLTMTDSVAERVPQPPSLEVGWTIALRTALERAITISDNAAAVLVGDRLGYASIDAALRADGYTVTTVNARATRTTARELGRMLEQMVGLRRAGWQPSAAQMRAMRALLLNQTRNDRIPLLLRPGTPVAHKTGEFNDVSNDAGIVYASTGPITIAALVDQSPNTTRSAFVIADLARMIVDAVDPSSGEGEAPAG